MADGGGNNDSGAASTETGTTTVVESPQQAVTPKKPKKRKKSESSDEQSSGATVAGSTTASDGDGSGEKQEAKKKDRFVWSSKLHGKFVRACNELGINDAVPMKILRRMNVDRLSRAQVASHLQKYRGSLSKRKDEETSGKFNRGDATTVMVVHHTPLDAASPSPPATATATAPAPAIPPSPESLFPDTMCQPPNGHSTGYAVAAANLLHQDLQLLLLPPAPVQHHDCFPPPPLLHQVGAVTIMGEKTPSMMQQQAAAATATTASQHGPTLVGVEQAAGALVPASGAENGPPVSMLQAFDPKANMMRLEEPETRMAQALMVVAKGEKGQRRAAEPEEAAAAAASLSPPGGIIERYWGSGDRPSWDLFGSRPISIVPTGISTLKD